MIRAQGCQNQSSSQEEDVIKAASAPLLLLGKHHEILCSFSYYSKMLAEKPLRSVVGLSLKNCMINVSHGSWVKTGNSDAHGGGLGVD